MKKVLHALTLAAVFAASAPAWSKSDTFRIEITGAGLTTPLEIDSIPIVNQFSIWSASFIEHPLAPVLAPPAELQRSRVVFHQRGREPMQEWHRYYVVTYVYDPAHKGGFIYFPGPNDAPAAGPRDGTDYQRNVYSIIRGTEGKWYRASPAWEQTVRPLIEKAVASAR
jgi:hypothetical protein